MGNTNPLSPDAVGCVSDDYFLDCGTTDAESESPEGERIIDEDIEDIIMMRMKYDEYTIDLSTILEEYSKGRGGEAGDNSTLATVATFETIEEFSRKNVEMVEQREMPTSLLEEESSSSTTNEKETAPSTTTSNKSELPQKKSGVYSQISISKRRERLLKEKLNQIRLDLEIARYETLLKEKAKQIRILEAKLGKVPSILSVE